ncbi:MAG TPA: polyprenyl diphosphate synthase [Longimicrobiales bacterium]|nr:polyprenyl diphosphate synthase [Longimicrobiales bacterium]
MKQRGLHAAVIMDGNGRWATSRGSPRTAGHRAGARAVRQIVESAPGHGIQVLTLFAFSSDNWKRPKGEVSSLMRLFEAYLRGETARCVAEGVRVRVIGRRDRLGERLLRAIEAAEQATCNGSRLELYLAVDYSSRDAIRRGVILPDVDLLIRTGGEQRLSDFLLWESAYAELIFTPKQWPDYGDADLAAAVAEYHARERRFGTLRAEPGRAGGPRAGGPRDDTSADVSDISARRGATLRLHT